MPNKIIPYNPNLKHFARKLRKESTLSEVLLWIQIKNRALGVQFHRQVPILNYIVDFYCHELFLAIEIDGSSHHGRELEDELRQKKLEDHGIRFIRFDDLDVKKNMIDVLGAIKKKVETLKDS